MMKNELHLLLGPNAYFDDSTEKRSLKTKARNPTGGLLGSRQRRYESLNE
jgi:hypothetical protein